MQTTDSMQTAIDAILEKPVEEAQQPETVEEDVVTIDASEEVEDNEEAEEVASVEAEAVDAEDEEPEEAPATFRVKIDGQEKEVTLEELKRGYSGQEYIQAKMQENAQLRRSAEEMFQALQQERAQVVAALQHIQQGIPAKPEPPSRELFDSDPIGYMEAKLSYDEQMAQYSEAMGQLQQAAEQQTHSQRIARQQYLKEQAEQLKAKVPELAKPETAAILKQQMITVGEKYGFSPEEINSVMDHRAVHILRDAVRYHELMAKKPDVQETVKSKVVKAGSKKVGNKAQTLQKQKERLRKSGRVDDALSLILNQ